MGFIRSASEGFFSIGLALTTCFSYAMLREKSRGDAITVMLAAMASLIGFSGIEQGNISVETLGGHNTFTVLFFKIKDTKFFRIRWHGIGADACYAEAVSGVIPALLVHGMWIVGIHGSYVLGSVIYENFGVISEEVVYNKTFRMCLSAWAARVLSCALW